MRALADVARGLRLGEYVRLGRGEEGTGGRDKPSILADTLEAVIGAVYLDRGLDAADALVHRLFDPVIERSARLGAGLDWKTSLQELTAAELLGVPEYHGGRERPRPPEVLPRLGKVGGKVLGSGEGRSKKEAEQQAAEAAWNAISAATAGATAEAPPAAPPTAGPPAEPRRSYARCLNFPRSRPSAAAWSSTWPAAPSPTSRCCTPGPCGATWPAPATSPARSAAAARQRRPPPRQVPVAARSATTPLLAHLGMSGQLLVGDAGPRRCPRTCGPGSPSPTAGPTCASPISARSATCSFARAGRSCPARSRTSPRTRWSRPSTDAAFAPAPGPAQTGIKRALLDQSLISGVGNIYADEALWRARLHWARPTDTLTRPQIEPPARGGRRGLRRSAARGRHLVRQPVRERRTGRAATSTGRWPSTAGRASPAGAAAPPSAATRS